MIPRPTPTQERNKCDAVCLGLFSLAIMNDFEDIEANQWHLPERNENLRTAVDAMVLYEYVRGEAEDKGDLAPDLRREIGRRYKEFRAEGKNRDFIESGDVLRTYTGDRLFKKVLSRKVNGLNSPGQIRKLLLQILDSDICVRHRKADVGRMLGFWRELQTAAHEEYCDPEPDIPPYIREFARRLPGERASA